MTKKFVFQFVCCVQCESRTDALVIGTLRDEYLSRNISLPI